MSMFGESRMYMEYMYYNLEEFFEEHKGTLEEFFEVLNIYFRYFKLKEKKDE